MTLEEYYKNQYRSSLDEDTREIFDKWLREFRFRNKPVDWFGNEGNKKRINEELSSYARKLDFYEERSEWRDWVREFFKKLKVAYGESGYFYIVADNTSYLSGTEQYVRVLRVLQGEEDSAPGNREKIAEKLGLKDPKDLRKYIGELIGTVNILGAEVKLDNPSRGNNIPESTVQPIFLPLTLTETGHLLQILENVSNADGAYSNSAKHIAEGVYSQLTEYAKGRVMNNFEDENPSFVDRCEPGYIFKNGSDSEKEARENQDIENRLSYAGKAIKRIWVDLLDEQGNRKRHYGSVYFGKHFYYLKEEDTEEKIELNPEKILDFDYIEDF